MSISITNGFSACAGSSASGWYGGVLVLDNPGLAYREMANDLTFKERMDHARQWYLKTRDVPRRILLLTGWPGEITEKEVVVAERLDGPACPREESDSPTLVWIERRGKLWHLVQFAEGTCTTVLSRNRTIRRPGVALTDRGALFCFERDTGPSTTCVEVVDASGHTIHQTDGRSPQLCATRDGYVLLSESINPDVISLRLASFSNEDQFQPAAITELKKDGYLFNGDAAWDASNGRLIIAAENAPAFGDSNQVGLHRTLHAWEWDLATAPQALGQLPTEEKSFKAIGMENMPPIKPTVRIEDGVPIVLFKQHRFTGFRGFGWDLNWCRHENGNWTAPARITPSTTTADTTFGLVRRGDTFVGLFPAQENRGGNGSHACSDVRVDLVTFDRNQDLGPCDVSQDKPSEYRYPKSCKRIAPEPAALPQLYEGRQLIWGDLHIHTQYSKCVSAVDGDPRENVRFARDVLGCRVFGITEHTPHTTGIESTWVYDTLEAEVGHDNVLLYASEPGMRGVRHTNWYTRDRETFEHLERIFISQRSNFPDTVRNVKEELPHDSVFVLRHFHGDAIPVDRITQHFDPHLEVAMEAMQGRGNAMLEANEGCGGLFPNAFLDAGCKIGLVGGTDHFREWCPNHFCLTGFWVKEVSPEGVWEALRNRYTIAMSNSRVAMSTVCKGMPMGSDITLGVDETMTVSVHASCGHPIRRIALMRDGELLDWVEVGTTEATVELRDAHAPAGRHWYVVTAEVATGFDDGVGICHASPYFVWKTPPAE